MKPPPAPFSVAELTVMLQDKRCPDEWLMVGFKDEGAGFFLELKTEAMDGKSPFRIDASELSDLAVWANQVCQDLSAQGKSK